MKTVKVEIHQDGKCAWCEIDGNFIYAKNADELKQTLDEMSEYNQQQYELAKADNAKLAYNHIA